MVTGKGRFRARLWSTRFEERGRRNVTPLFSLTVRRVCDSVVTTSGQHVVETSGVPLQKIGKGVSFSSIGLPNSTSSPRKQNRCYRHITSNQNRHLRRSQQRCVQLVTGQAAKMKRSRLGLHDAVVGGSRAGDGAHPLCTFAQLKLGTRVANTANVNTIRDLSEQPRGY